MCNSGRLQSRTEEKVCLPEALTVPVPQNGQLEARQVQSEVGKVKIGIEEVEASPFHSSLAGKWRTNFFTSLETIFITTFFEPKTTLLFVKLAFTDMDGVE
ncbi:hypothetical protein HG530_007210 [Fusarium avenaceum]|nr:hypothetical protein HG530_007210 [Fusarium avenaceum]